MIHSNGRLIENPMEQRVLKKIIKMKKEGKSLRAISSEVSTQMVPISFKTVQRLLKSINRPLNRRLSQQNSPLTILTGSIITQAELCLAHGKVIACRLGCFNQGTIFNFFDKTVLYNRCESTHSAPLAK